MINAPPPVMATPTNGQPMIGDWFSRHPQFLGDNEQPGLQPGQRPQFGPGRMIGFLGSLMNGQHPPRFDAWRDRRMAAGLPYTGQQFQPQQQTNPLFNAQPMQGSGYGGGGY